jgi:Tfp pilus assembly protein PilN
LKPLHLNLAARPYRDYKPLYAVVVVTSIVIALLMLNNVDTYYRYVTETQTTRATIAKLERQGDDEHNRAVAAENKLKAFDIVALDNETRFINARLAERAFSWSELLDRLEDVIPREVRIRNIQPTFQKNAFVHLEMTCESKSSSGMLDTITAMQRDAQFANPFPHSESVADAPGAPAAGPVAQPPGAAAGVPSNFVFTVGVDFKPTIARAAER